MGYGVPAAVAAALRFSDRPVVAIAGDGDFLMNGQELATAAQYACDLLVIVVDNGSYGTIRMHQEREYPKRVSATDAQEPGFRGAGPGLWRLGRHGREDGRFRGPRSTRQFKKKGIRLIHCKTDVEQISNSTTISRIRETERH
jgi:acetolactate synthase I/II/III large subunit